MSKYYDDDIEDFLKTFVFGMHNCALYEQDGWESWYDAAEQEYGEKYCVIYNHMTEIRGLHEENHRNS